jgi:hypothetical protein
MNTLNPNKLTVKLIGNQRKLSRQSRKYTLTHSDVTGDLFLSIGDRYDQDELSGFYNKFMRDEVLAEVRVNDKQQPEFHVHCHVSGGLVLGSASWRYAIFQRHMLQVLQAFRFGDAEFVDSDPLMRRADVIVHFHSSNPLFDVIENWGYLDDFQLREVEYATA